MLEELGLASLVDGVVTSPQAGVAKPDPALFEHALAVAGDVAPADAVMVGDSVLTDVRGAQAAGIEAVLVARGAPPGFDADGVRVPDGVAVLDDLAGLREWVRYRRRARCPPSSRPAPRR